MSNELSAEPTSAELSDAELSTKLFKIIEGEVYEDALGRRFPVALRRPAEPVQLVLFHGLTCVQYFQGGSRFVARHTPKRFFATSRRPSWPFADRLDPLAYEGVTYVDATGIVPPANRVDCAAFWRDAGAEIGRIEGGRFVPSSSVLPPARGRHTRPTMTHIRRSDRPKTYCGREESPRSSYRVVVAPVSDSDRHDCGEVQRLGSGERACRVCWTALCREYWP